MDSWQMHEAKTQLSRVIDRAIVDGPQMITRHGSERAVVLSVTDYEKLLKNKTNFVQFLIGGPKVDGLAVERSADLGRPVKL